MSAPNEIRQLVEHFDQNRSVLKSSKYKEAQLRQEYLDPFFLALGWDVNNKSGYTETYRDVIIESSVEVEGAQRAPDYSFRVGGKRLFFVEAKKPSVNIETDTHPAFQVRRYAWSAKLPLSILTDFEEFAVYDCRTRPDKSDSAATSRIKLLNYKEYLTRWNEIADVFSKEAIQHGKFDQFAETAKGKRGTQEVDDAFLQEIEKWREILAKNIAIRNPSLSVPELNYAVQMTIDRIIFLRICEDRQIEPENQLKDASASEGIYPNLINLFRQADSRYNSGLFHFNTEKGQSSTPDDLTPKLTIDDKVLKEIVSGLYYPSPYVFRVLPAEILGQVYERFLGKVIRLTASHQAKVEEKPEVRKAGGVYYTPTYIVDYIVKNTVGKLLEGKTPAQAANLKIVDPACGSGSFLLGAYQYLLDWHVDWYTNHDPEKWAKGKSPAIYQAQGGWRLTTAEKKKILLNNIHGVDIDPQAVEVTKLSLSLKVLEGESQETINSQLSLFKERALPDLAKNIQCGNSLIGPDYSEGRLFADEEERMRVNPFDWHVAFPQVFTQGGFDAVIGNPPYGADFSKEVGEYLHRSFETYVWRGESYLVFVEKANQLLRIKGLFGNIIPDTYINLGFTKALRRFLLENTNILEIDIMPAQVFINTTVDTTILFTTKLDKKPDYQKSNVLIKIFNKKNKINDFKNPDRILNISTSSWRKNGNFVVSSDNNDLGIISKMEINETNIEKLTSIFYGIKVYQIGKGKPPQTKLIRDTKPFTAATRLRKSFLPFYDGKHIGRYQLLWRNNNWLDYGIWLAEPRFPEKFEGEKILIRKIVGRTLIATYVKGTSYCNTLLYVLKLNDTSQVNYQFLLAILNSHLLGWYFRKKFNISSDDTFPQILIRDIQQFPIPLPQQNDSERIGTLVNNMLSLQEKFVRTPQQKEALQREIANTDKQIDNLVYQLYGLTPEEIKIVEGEK